uniref:Uncharacterized protein n=1 Tax=Oryza barthii TaxID=65489 RepID=A0A679BAY7_9ORYZ|nr:hypothetical protein [Oryza barthii]
MDLPPAWPDPPRQPPGAASRAADCRSRAAPVSPPLASSRRGEGPTTAVLAAGRLCRRAVRAVARRRGGGGIEEAAEEDEAPSVPPLGRERRGRINLVTVSHECKWVINTSLPLSLKTFRLYRCSDVLTSSCQTIGHKNWQKIKHIPNKHF